MCSSDLINAKDGYSYGFETGASQGLFDSHLTLGANYSFVERKADSTTATNPITNMPAHRINGSLIFTDKGKFDAIVLASYERGRWFTTTSRTTFDRNNGLFLIDIKFNYRIIDDIQLSYGVSNLLDKNYYYSYGYYMAGRRIFANVEYRF